MVLLENAVIVDYTLLVKGNGGENQFIASVSSGQGGFGVLIITDVAVDASGGVVLERHDVPNFEINDLLKKHLERWSNVGIKPSPQEIKHNKRRIDAIMRRWENHCEV